MGVLRSGGVDSFRKVKLGRATAITMTSLNVQATLMGGVHSSTSLLPAPVQVVQRERGKEGGRSRMGTRSKKKPGG